MTIIRKDKDNDKYVFVVIGSFMMLLVKNAKITIPTEKPINL